MSEELKPCPFCGSEDYLHHYRLASLEEHPGFVRCNKCGGDAALEVWQSRPLEDALIAERDALKAKLEIMKEALEKCREPDERGTINGRCAKIADEALRELEKK